MSSAKQTESGDDSASQSPDPAPETPARPLQLKLIVGLAVLAALFGGWAALLGVNRWHFTMPVLFLLMGWAAILLVAYFLFRMAWTAADEHDDMDDEEFWRPVGERDELEAEKRALIKAIKEIEFDHQMGKMSDADADELTRYYRARAIEVIKELESTGGDDAELPLAERIQRDVEARMALSRRRKSKPAAAPATEESSP